MISLAVTSTGVQGALLGPFGFLVAFFVGIVSCLSPCVVPLIPGYLSYVSGLTGEQMESSAARRKVLLATSLFVLGFATMFTALGAAASLVGTLLLRNLSAIERVAGVIVLVMGLAFVVPGLMPLLGRERRPLLGKVKPGVASAYPLGLAFAAGWTPCVGPGLGVMLSLGAIQGSTARASLLLFFFSLGFGTWFILAAIGLRRALSASSWLRRHARALQVVGGTFMITIGVLLVSGQWNNVIAPLRRLINHWTPPV